MVSKHHAYESPDVTEYGQVESITQDKDKCGSETDEYSEGTPLTGSVVDEC